MQHSSPVYIPNFLDRKQAFRLSAMFHNHRVTNNIVSKDVYNFTPFDILLVNKTSNVSAIYKKNLLPTYSLGVWAEDGTVVRPHRMSQHSEITLAIQLAHEGIWSWFIQNDDGYTTDYSLEPGAALLFRGYETTNWRPILKNKTSCYVLLNYVYCDGPHVGLAFTKPQ